MKTITFFDAKIARQGGRYVIFIPAAIYPQIERVAGKKVRVEIKELE